MYITAKEAKHNVEQFRKNYGTSNLEKILKLIELVSKNGATNIKISNLREITYINKKDYYLLKQNGFIIKFSAVYERTKVNKWCDNVKTREISLQEYFCNNSLEDKTVDIFWD